MLTLEKITFAYDDLKVLDNISFTLKKDKHLAIIGESGCGKSTLLKLIYGILGPDAGHLYFQDKQLKGPLFHLVPGYKGMGYVNQDAELSSFRTVSENIGQHLSNTQPRVKESYIRRLLNIVDLDSFYNVKVEQLSGGQKQRIALAKVLTTKPKLILLDEPFHHIDNFRRRLLRKKLYDYLSANHISSIIATHDKADILSFTDQTLVMKSGKVLAFKNTIELYKNPMSFYTASLFGEVNEIRLDSIGISNNQNTILIYPFEIEIIYEGNNYAKVIKSYFMGQFYFIEVLYKSQHICLQHPCYLEKGTDIRLLFNIEVIRQRIPFL